MTLFDEGHTNPLGNGNQPPRKDGFVMALDAEPFVPSFVKDIDSRTDLIGAAMLPKYVTSNRYYEPNDVGTYNWCPGTPSKRAGLVPRAAMITIKTTLPVKCFYFGDPSQPLNANEAYVKLLPQNCNATNPCNTLEIGYGYTIFGKTRTVKVSQLIFTSPNHM